MTTVLETILHQNPIEGILPLNMDQFFSFVVGGKFLPPPKGLKVRNHFASSVHHFRPKARLRRRSINELVIHDTTSSSVARTVGDLKGKGFSVHLIVGPDGRVTQHGDLLVFMNHGPPHNTRSVGIEVVNPYYPSKLTESMPWNESIKAGWAHLGQYVLPTPEQAEAVSQLIGWLTSHKSGLDIPRTWIGESDGKMAMNGVKGSRDPRPGIYAHTYYSKNRADGSWLVLYAWLRLEHGLSAEEAYEMAKKLEPKNSRVKLPIRRLPQVPTCVRPRVDLEFGLDEAEFETGTGQFCTVASAASKPTPGRFYTLKKGVDARGLFDLAGRAYGVRAGKTRLRMAQRINSHPYNHRFWRASLAGRQFPQGRISFSPRFTRDITRQADAKGVAPRGGSFATIWIPDIK